MQKKLFASTNKMFCKSLMNKQTPNNRTNKGELMMMMMMLTTTTMARMTRMMMIERQPTELLAASRRLYHERVIDHYENPRNVGSMDPRNPDVGTGLVGAPACGDVMKMQIAVKDGVVIHAVFKTFGCGSAIAASSLATEWVKGKTIEECLSIKNTDLAYHLALPPVKLHCSMLAEDAIKAAVHNYFHKSKKGAAT